VVSTYDGNGNSLVSLIATDEGEGAVVMFDRAGNVGAQWP
jgi:hypothetical protein